MKLSTVLLCFVVSVGASDLHKKVRYFETLDSVDLNVVSRRKRSADGREVDSKQISFRALGRRFNLVLYPGSPVLSPNFKAKTVDSNGNTRSFHVSPNNFYTGHLADDSSVSVDAHFEDGILSSNIRFPHDTYVVEPAWRHRLPSENYTMITYRGSDVNWEDIFPIDPKTGKRTKMKDGIRLNQEAKSERTTDSTYRNASSPGDTMDEMVLPQPGALMRDYQVLESILCSEGNSRHKRAAVRKNTCPLLVVADYHFFKDMGHSKRETTASFLIAAIQNVNQHYKSTEWDASNGYLQMGFQIEEMLIHTQHTLNKSFGHYNSNMTWGYNEKLYAFSRSRHINRFCLAHLFTSYPFPDNVLGLAFIAPESAASAGGICSVSSSIEGALVYPRTGWSSAKNTRSQQVLSLQYELVTTHELGHNWGAEHDPDTDDCGPSSRNSGKYVMWPYAVPGFEDNNKFFSPCSKRYVAPVLRSKSAFCFRGQNMIGINDIVTTSSQLTNRETASVDLSLSMSSATEFLVKVDPADNQTDSGTEGDFKGLCGNGIVEKGEECDVGFTEEEEDDPCCTKKCKLKDGAVCSDFNHACCQGCQVANSTVLCEAKNPLACRDESFCTGKVLDCPVPAKLSNISCLDMGKCFNGSCLNYCALLGIEQGKVMTPCLCVQNVTAMCRRCCSEVGENGMKGDCLPTKEVLIPGRMCDLGFCNDNGMCEKVEQQLAHRIFNFIQSLTVSKLVEVMRTNIVGTVIILSLLIWIPASWIVSCVDKRKIVQDENYLQRWISRENTILGMSREDLSNFRIKNSRFTRVPLHSQGQGQGHGNNNFYQRRTPTQPSSTAVDGALMETIAEEEAATEREAQGKKGQMDREMKLTHDTYLPGSVTTDAEGGFSGSDDVFDGGAVMTLGLGGEETQMDSMDSADSIDLSATPGSVSEEEGRTVANV